RVSGFERFQLLVELVVLEVAQYRIIGHIVAPFVVAQYLAEVGDALFVVVVALKRLKPSALTRFLAAVFKARSLVLKDCHSLSLFSVSVFFWDTRSTRLWSMAISWVTMLFQSRPLVSPVIRLVLVAMENTSAAT
ncbi:MAG TPA: hypothetical protein P5244_05590, partial [Syntrophales bacterium]|nr:hypothetical protein [Syntrophales bacterium]